MKIVGTSKSGATLTRQMRSWRKTPEESTDAGQKKWTEHLNFSKCFHAFNNSCDGLDEPATTIIQKRHVSSSDNMKVNVPTPKVPLFSMDWNNYPVPQVMGVPAYPYSSTLNGNGKDLRRFLEEVGTDPKEARYWLKQFQTTSDSFKPFAVVQVDKIVFANPDTLDRLSSCIAFLHRCDMKMIIVHGDDYSSKQHHTSEQLQAARIRMAKESMMLVSILESHGAPARPLFAGSNVLMADTDNNLNGKVKHVNIDPIKWTLRSGHIPILQSIGETAEGQLVNIDSFTVAAEVSKRIQPLKVMFINDTGGIKDKQGEVVANVNLPADMDTAEEKSWCTPNVKMKLHMISRILNSLPSQSSVVITSASTLLTELFTHHGSGTFFKNTEPIIKHKSLQDVDTDKLLAFINRSFGKDLKEDYLLDLEERLDVLYLSANYNAAAIITKQPGMEVSYLDKLAVSSKTQGEGTADMLWECIRRDYKSLFWRSRGTNRINPWYFKRCEGSWSNGNWTVFWFGLTSHKQSSDLIEYALDFPDAFFPDGQITEKIQPKAPVEVHEKLAG